MFVATYQSVGISTVKSVKSDWGLGIGGSCGIATGGSTRDDGGSLAGASGESTLGKHVVWSGDDWDVV